MNVRSKKVDEFGGTYTFCPGKATWSESMALVFHDCRLAVETGIMPAPGPLCDQDDLFADVFYDFVDHWKHRNYQKILKDATTIAAKLLEMALGGKTKVQPGGSAGRGR